MRLDLFLKLARLVKRRSVAREMCDQGRVRVNDQVAKPAKEIKPGDRIELHYASRRIGVTVLALPAAGRAVPAASCYEVTEDIRIPPPEPV